MSDIKWQPLLQHLLPKPHIPRWDLGKYYSKRNLFAVILWWVGVFRAGRMQTNYTANCTICKVFLHRFFAVINLLFPNVTSCLNIHKLYQEWGNGASSELLEPVMSYCIFQLTTSAWYFSHSFTFHFFSLLSSPEARSATCSPLIVPDGSEITSFYGCFFNLILCTRHQINAASHFSYLVALPVYNCGICNESWCYGAEKRSNNNTN